MVDFPLRNTEECQLRSMVAHLRLSMAGYRHPSTVACPRRNTVDFPHLNTEECPLRNMAVYQRLSMVASPLRSTVDCPLRRAVECLHLQDTTSRATSRRGHTSFEN